eukprot:gene32732-40401_t
MQARDLKDTGSFLDPQDPALRVTVKDKDQQEKITARIKDAKTSAVFPEVFTFDISQAEYDKGLEIEIEALNVSSSGSKTHVGIGRAVLKTAVSTLDNKPVTFIVQLAHMKKKQPEEQKGVVELIGTLEVIGGGAKNTPSAATAAPSVATATNKTAEKNNAKTEAASAPTSNNTNSAKTPTNNSNTATPATSTNTSTVKPTLYRVILDQMHASDLVDTGSFLDAQDPAVRVTIGGVEKMTARQQDAKTDAKFPEVLEFDLNPTVFEKGDLEILVEVLNVSVSGSKTNIGVGTVLLKTALPSVGSQGVTFTVPLIHKKKLEKGKLEVRRRIEALSEPTTTSSVTAPATAPAVSKKDEKIVITPPATSGVEGNIKLRITRIEAQKMKAVEMLGGKNDLYIKLECLLQDTHRFFLKTPVKDEAGSEAVWEYPPSDPSVQFEMTAAEWKTGALFRATAMDENNILSHTTIGTGEAPLPTNSSGVIEVRIPVSDSKHKVSGEVVVFIAHETIGAKAKPVTAPESTKTEVTKAQTAKPSATAPSAHVPNFTVGKLLIKRIVCQDLPNVESFGGQNDPYVVVQFGAETRQTECIEGGGGNVSFDFLDICFEADREMIEFDPLLVKLVTSTVMAAEQKELPLDRQLLEAGGVLYIHRVRAFDLKNTHGMTSSAVNSPIVKLTLETFTHTTPALDLSRTSGQALFDHLDLEIAVSAQSLLSALLNVEVLNGGVISNTSIGKGSVAIKSAGHKTGTEVELRVDLADNGKTTGRVVIFASTEKKTLKPVAADVPIQEGFTAGQFHIKSVTGHNLKNTEMFGGKQDPYIQFQFGSAYKERTITQNNAGKEVYWTDLDLKCDVSRADLMDTTSQLLTVTAFDDNDLTSDALIGVGTLSLRAVSAVIGKDTKLTVELLDVKKKVAGTLSLVVVINETIPEEKLIIPKGLVQGCFRVRKIVAHGVLAGNMVSAPAPSFQLKFGEWTTRTSVGLGHDPSWDLLDIISPTLAVVPLTTTPLQVELFDGKTLTAQGTVVNLLRPTAMFNKEIELDIKLTNAKNPTKNIPSGRVTLFLTVIDPPPVEKVIEAVVERPVAFNE